MTHEHAALKRRVEQALADCPDIDTGSITVEIVGGRVVLMGATDTWMQREEAERVAWATPGVVAVENELIVRVPEPVRG